MGSIKLPLAYMKFSHFLAFTIVPAALAAPFLVSAAVPKVQFAGQLIELSTTDLPATIVVRENPAGPWIDHVVTVASKAVLDDAMDAWITGDALTVSGTEDASTGVFTAAAVKNQSLDAKTQRGANGWVKAVDPDASTITITWQGTDTVVNVTDKTRLVVPPLNPAKVSDFQAGDRVRLRMEKGSKNVADIVIALRRADQVMLKARTRPFHGTVVGADAGRKLLSVQLAADPALRFDDVNNLVGVAGEIVSVSYDDATRFVSAASAADVGAGDGVDLVGRVGDDGVIAARVVHVTNPVASSGAPFTGYVGTVTGSEPADRVLNVKLDTGATWTVEYTDATKAYHGAEPADIGDIHVGDHVVVKGGENRQLYTIAAQAIATLAPAERPVSAVHPLERVRPLDEMIRERIKAGLGQMHEDDFTKDQAPATAEQE